MIKKEGLTFSMKQFDEIGRFIIDSYDHQQPFSSFLPGIAGLHGIPMWVFYVNRGQVVSSFGIENKDHPILEFEAANKAYQNTGMRGFRTFINAGRGDVNWHREFFSPWHAKDVYRKMYIGMNEVEIEEVNPSLGYQINVVYFALANMPFAGLVRRVTIKNLQDSLLALEILDGLPGIVPYGVNDYGLKHVSRTNEAWMQVDNLENRLPFYRLKATPGDTADVQAILAGNYAFAFHENTLLPAVGDPHVVFGMDTGHVKPHRFFDEGLDRMLEASQILEGRSLCALFGAKISIEPGEGQLLTSVYGYAEDLPLIRSRAEKILRDGFIVEKLRETRQLTSDLTQCIDTASSFSVFDLYSRQTFLDNFLRGGYPILLGGKHVMHVFSRKHGDLERDYNYFVLLPEYYSYGNGHYRDINQNRRNDVFFFPPAGMHNVRFFMSLIQPDGYNPLFIDGLTFTLPEEDVDGFLGLANTKTPLRECLCGKFTPGKLLSAALAADLTIPIQEFFERVFAEAESHIEAEFGQGYWIDHWTYNLDLIESYLAIFPDKKVDLLVESDPLPFFDSSYIVQPRSERFVRYQGKTLQLNAVRQDQEKLALIDAREAASHWVRSDNGKGEIFRLPLLSKLGLLTLIKFATLDPHGMGIQMEAGRPGWYDALNGLPGLFGSSMPETYELLRLVNFLREFLDETPMVVALPVEAQGLIEEIMRLSEESEDSFTIWHRLSSVLEKYRERIRLGFDGKTIPVDLKPVLEVMREHLNKGIEKAQRLFGSVAPTYFINKVTDYTLQDTRDEEGNPQIQINGFEPVPLPPFLEGPVRLMKISDQADAKLIDQRVRDSLLFDQKLKMYKINAPLDDQPHDIGRARAFTPGWLENESIWMHMAFKYLLAMLESGLYDAFFDAMQVHLPAFMRPEIYGRSPLENSSFIVSSAHPDSSLHGRGFVARLSGSTAEFLSMWVIMTSGRRAFRMKDGELVLCFEPILPDWLFDEDGLFSFRFLGTCDVHLHNTLQKSTYLTGVFIKKIVLNIEGQSVSIDGSIIPAPYAEAVRNGEVVSVDLYFDEKV